MTGYAQLTKAIQQMNQSFPQLEEIAAFYDNFSDKLLRDFVYGNPRVNKAVERVCSEIDDNVKTLLDVGCGIGASSDYFRRRKPWVSVTGVDISPRNIQIAKRLFERDGVSFKVSDMSIPPTNCYFDLISLLDVYEHIPRKKWDEFNRILKICLSDTGTLVLTVPSPLHQNFLKENKPEGLQVVDETVTFGDIDNLSKDLDATVVSYQMTNIWKTNDYVHVIIKKRPSHTRLLRPSKNTIFQRATRKLLAIFHQNEKCNIQNRRKLVNNKLGLNL